MLVWQGKGGREEATHAKMTRGFVGDVYTPVPFACIMRYMSTAMTTSRHSLPRPSADTRSNTFRVLPKRRWTGADVISEVLRVRGGEDARTSLEQREIDTPEERLKRAGLVQQP